MKTVKEILNEILVDVENRPVFFREQAQKEAYNQALEDACNNVVVYDTVPRGYTSCTFDRKSILKLKK